MDTLPTCKGSPPLEEAEVSSVLEVKQKFNELGELINRLPKPNGHGSTQDKKLEEELQQQKTLKTYYQTQCNELSENKILLEKRVRELEASNLTLNEQIGVLREKWLKAEESQQRLRDNNHAAILHSNKELTVKHNKLREFVKAHLSHLQALTDSNLATTSQPPNEQLAVMSTRFSKRLEDMENSRKALRKSLSVYSRLVYTIMKILQNRNQTRHRKVAKLKCRVCSRKFPSLQKLHMHRIIVHTVQKSTRFLQKQFSAKQRTLLRKVILKLAKTKGGNGKAENWNVIPFTTANETKNDMSRNSSAKVHTPKISDMPNLSANPSTSSHIQSDQIPVPVNAVEKESKTSDKRKSRDRHDRTTSRRVTRSRSISTDTPRNLDGVSKTPENKAAASVVLQIKPASKSNKSYAEIVESIKQAVIIKTITTVVADSIPVPSTSGASVTSNFTPRVSNNGKKSHRLLSTAQDISLKNKTKSTATLKFIDVATQAKSGPFSANKLDRGSELALDLEVNNTKPPLQARKARIQSFESSDQENLNDATEIAPNSTSLTPKTNYQQPECNVVSTNTPKKRKLEPQDNFITDPKPKRKRPGRKPKQLFVTGQKHEVDRSKRLGFYCRCGSGHGNLRGLKDHIRYFTRERKFVCRIPSCSLKFAYLSALRAHMKSIHKMQILPEHLAKGCSDCGESFATIKEVFEHRRQKHSTPNGGKTRKQPSICIPLNLEISIVQQNPESCSNLTNANAPNSDEANWPPIFSSIPTTSINTVYGETKHHSFSYSEEPNIYFCKCGLRFGSMDTLSAHIRYFGLGKHFACSHCETLFPSLRDTNVHIRKCHRDAQPQTQCVGCTHCGVVFADRTEYRKHLVITGVEPNNPESLGCPTKNMTRKFNAVSTDTYEIVNTTEEPNKNQATTSTSSTLEDHLELKFVCKICNKRFLFAYTLRKHMIGAHKIVENLGVGCQNCGQFFLDHMELRRHNNMIHKTEASTEVEMKYVPPSTTSQTSNTSQQTNSSSSSGILLPQDNSQIHAKAPLNSQQKKRKRRKRGTKRMVGKIFVCEWCPDGTVRYDQYVNLKNHAKSCHPQVANQLLKYACRVCAKPFSTREEGARHRASEHANIY